MWQPINAIIKRDVFTALRHPVDITNPLLFFIVVVSLCPLAISSDLTLLRAIAPGIIWVAALLSMLLGFDRLFRDDYLDGSLELLLLSQQSFITLVLTKIIVHWLLTGLPLLLVSPLLALALNLSATQIQIMFLSLLLGTPTLSLIGAMVSALTVSLSKNGLLLSLLVLPLTVPVLIFGTNAIIAVDAGLAISSQLAWLSALLILALITVPAIVVWALRTLSE